MGESNSRVNGKHKGGVTVMTSPCVMPNNLGTLISSGSVARQRLLEDVMSLTLLQASILLSSCNVNESVMAIIRKPKAIPSDSRRYSRGGRSLHLFLLTSQVDDELLDLLPAVFMRLMKIHFFGILAQE